MSVTNAQARVYSTVNGAEQMEVRAAPYEVKPLKIRPRFSSYVPRMDENYGSADATL